MNTDTARKSLLVVFIVTALLFLLVRLLGSSVFSTSWAFDQWFYIPWWYLTAWAVVAVAVVAVFVWRPSLVDSFFESWQKGLIGISILGLLLLIFRFNSFLYGGGNYQIAKLAQTDTIIHRWYEFGALWIADLIYRVISLLSFSANTAAYISWKGFGFGGTILTLIAAILLSRDLAAKTMSRAILFTILLFGPQTFLYFNFVGYEPLLVAIIYWFILFAVRAQIHGKSAYLVPLWSVTLLGLLLHVSMLMLIPAAVFVTISSPARRSGNSGFILGLLILFALGVTVYLRAHGSMEFGQYILSLGDRTVQSNYTLFSAKHIIDIIQLLLLAFPQGLILLVLLATRRSDHSRYFIAGTLGLLSISGLAVVFMMEPLRGMALDTPIMTTFLAPLAPLLALLVSERAESGTVSSKATGLVAALAFLVPFSIMPVYSRIEYADGYIQAYLNKNPSYWYEGGAAVRDAYFYHEEDPQKPNANKWDQKIPIQSQDYLDLTAAKEYILAQMYPEALQKLYKLKAKNRYWIEPRFLIVTVQNKIGRYDLAKPEIDSCLMINPYDKACLVSLYRYYLNTNDIPRAIDEVNRVIKIYPHDNELKADLAIYLYRSRDFKAADSLSAELIAQDTTLAYPYLIRGFIAELKNEPRIAIPYYEAFIKKAPDAEETPQIRKKLNKLVLDLKKKTR